MLNNNSYGVITTALSSNTVDTKVTLAAASKGKIYGGQKLVLTYPDKSNPLLLTAAGNSTTSDTQINLASFTPNIIYPVGSVLSPLLYDFTNVITGGATNLYQGITTSYIYLRPEEFLTPSTASFSMYSRDFFASVQPNTFISRSSVYGSFFIPDDYEITAVDVYGANNRTFDLLESAYNGSSASTIQASGTMNTTMTLTTAKELAEGKYGIIRIYLGASSDKIYGARISIQEV